jgi:hypothetical protein
MVHQAGLVEIEPAAALAAFVDLLPHAPALAAPCACAHAFLAIGAVPTGTCSHERGSIGGEAGHVEGAAAGAGAREEVIGEAVTDGAVGVMPGALASRLLAQAAVRRDTRTIIIFTVT